MMKNGLYAESQVTCKQEARAKDMKELCIKKRDISHKRIADNCSKAIGKYLGN
jgi:hypothetical protein